MTRSKKSRPAVSRILEALEERALLSNGFDLASAQEFYPDFVIAADAAVYEIEAADLSVESLKEAIARAEQTSGDDLIVLHTTEERNAVAFNADSEFVVDVEGKGRLTVISWGSNGVTFDANQYGRLFCVQSGVFQLGGVTLADGYARTNLSGDDSSFGMGGGLANAGETVLVDVVVQGCSAGSKSESGSGSVYSRGGGLYNTGTLIVIGCRLVDNVAKSGALNASNNTACGFGGALYNGGGTVMIRNTVLSGNIAEAKTLSYTVVTGQTTEIAYVSQEGSGGAVYSSGGSVSIEGGAFADNSAYLGGAIFALDAAVLTLTDISLTGNRAVSDGGAVYSHSAGGSFVAERCDFFANDAGRDGGAVYSHSATTFRNTVLSGNIAGHSGGAFALIGRYVQDVGPVKFTLINCTVAGNEAGSLDPGNGGGLYFSGIDSSQIAAKLYIHNSILVNNRVVFSDLGTDFNLAKAKANDSCFGYYTLTTFSTWTLGGNNPVYQADIPLFVRDYNFDDKTKGDYQLVSDGDSQAVDAGGNDNASPAELGENTKDLFGRPRIYNGTVDLGACEYQGVPSVYSSVVTTLNDSFDAADGEWSLREAVYWLTEYAVITFAEGLTGTITLAQGELLLDRSLTIDGENRITLDAGQKSCVVNVSAESDSAPISLIGLAIRNGNAVDADGGGIYNTGILTLTNCVISGNAALNGGGIYNTGILTLTNCAVSGNAASDGGGIYNTGALTLTGCTISGNTASDGGGIDNSGMLTLYNSIVALNTKNGAADIVNNSGTVNAYSALSSFSAWNTSELCYLYDASLPLFDGTDDQDYTLCADSQAADIGNNDYVSVRTDLAGNSRIVNGIVDLGASELLKTGALFQNKGEGYTVQKGCSLYIAAADLTEEDLTYWWNLPGGEAGVFVQGDKGFWLNTDEIKNLSGNAAVVSLLVKQNGFIIASAQTSIQLLAAAPTLSVRTADYADGQILKLVLNMFLSGGEAVAQWSINWGDGSIEKIDNLSHLLKTSHCYMPQNAEAAYTVTLEIADSAGNASAFALLRHTVSRSAVSAEITPLAALLPDTNSFEISGEEEFESLDKTLSGEGAAALLRRDFRAESVPGRIELSIEAAFRRIQAAELSRRRDMLFRIGEPQQTQPAETPPAAAELDIFDAPDLDFINDETWNDYAGKFTLPDTLLLDEEKINGLI